MTSKHAAVGDLEIERACFFFFLFVSFSCAQRWASVARGSRLFTLLLRSIILKARGLKTSWKRIKQRHSNSACARTRARALPFIVTSVKREDKSSEGHKSWLLRRDPAPFKRRRQSSLVTKRSKKARAKEGALVSPREQ